MTYLARSANLPTGLYILPSVIPFFNCRQIISGSTAPIFAIFEYAQSGPLFLIPQGTLPWQLVKEKAAFFSDQSTLSRCHSATVCDIAISISND